MLKAFTSLMLQSCLKKNICKLRSLCSTLELMKGALKVKFRQNELIFFRGDLNYHAYIFLNFCHFFIS